MAKPKPNKIGQIFCTPGKFATCKPVKNRRVTVYYETEQETSENLEIPAYEKPGCRYLTVEMIRADLPKEYLDKLPTEFNPYTNSIRIKNTRVVAIPLIEQTAYALMIELVAVLGNGHLAQLVESEVDRIMAERYGEEQKKQDDLPG